MVPCALDHIDCFSRLMPGVCDPRHGVEAIDNVKDSSFIGFSPAAAGLPRPSHLS